MVHVLKLVFFLFLLQLPLAVKICAFDVDDEDIVYANDGGMDVNDNDDYTDDAGDSNGDAGVDFNDEYDDDEDDYEDDDDEGGEDFNDDYDGDGDNDSDDEGGVAVNDAIVGNGDSNGNGGVYFNEYSRDVTLEETSYKDVTSAETSYKTDVTTAETSYKTVIGTVIPDPQVCGGVTFDGETPIALAPKQIWDDEAAKCTATYKLRCISGYTKEQENACKAEAEGVTLTIVGYTGSTGDPAPYETEPLTYPTAFTLPHDTFYTFVQEGVDAVNTAYN